MVLIKNGWVTQCASFSFPRDPLRQAMPEDLPGPSLSLYVDPGMTRVRLAVIEWLNVRYRNELRGAIGNEGAFARYA